MTGKGKKRKWKRAEVDFDEHGRLVVGGAFAGKLKEILEQNGKLVVYEIPPEIPPEEPPPPPDTLCPVRTPPEPIPNIMCDCFFELAWKNDGRPYGGQVMPEVQPPT